MTARLVLLRPRVTHVFLVGIIILNVTFHGKLRTSLRRKGVYRNLEKRKIGQIESQIERNASNVRSSP